MCRFKTSPACTGTTRTCVSTRGVITSSAYQEKATKSSHLTPEVHQRHPWILPFFSLRTDRQQHFLDSSNHSLHLTKLLSSSYPGETLEGTSREMVRFVFRSHEKFSRTICAVVSLEASIIVSPDFALTRTTFYITEFAHTCTCTCTYTYTYT